MGAGARDDRADRAEAVGVVGERAARLETQVALGEMRIVLRDVRRVADDRIERERGIERRVPVALQPVQRAAGALRVEQLVGVALRDRERGRRTVERPHACIGALGRDRHGDRAAAGAEVEHGRVRQPVDRIERGFDEQLGFRARDQHVGRHVERAAEELAHPDQLRDGFAGDAARFECAVAFDRGRVERRVAARDQLCAGPAERVREQHACIDRVERRGAQQGVGGGVGHRGLSRLRRATRAARPGAR